MSSKTEISPELIDQVVNLPLVVCNNLHKKIVAKKINPKELKRRSKNPVRSDGLVVDFTYPEPSLPIPKFPLIIDWQPHHLCFEIDDEPVVNILSVWNECPRTIYINCSGFWGEAARLGASWCCQPRTRFHLAPGMVSRLTVTATPRSLSPIPSTYAGLQLAAAHMRDHVVGYYAVPLDIRFLNYKPPLTTEGE